MYIIAAAIIYVEQERGVFMSKREATIELVKTLPEYKIDIVSAFIQFLASDMGNDYEEALRHSLQQANEGKFIYKTMDELREMEN